MASFECCPGVSLSMLFQWIWPAVRCGDIADMFAWVCTYELEKLRFPTPRLIDTTQQKQLKKLFAAMDHKGHGYCTVEDIAGGERNDNETKVKNIVDADTVRAVTGDCHIDLPHFLELMCEEDF